jgi:hypothetical protein
MTAYVRTAKSNGRQKRPPISPYALHVLQRVATWQRDAGHYATASDIAEAGGRRDWLSLQGLLRRGLLNTTDDGRIRITGEGWRYLRLHRV